MERMDRARRLAGIGWVLAGVPAMVVWTMADPRHPPGMVTWTVVAVVALGTSTARTPQPWRWYGGRAAGVVIGVLLVGAVADRFGLLGGPGDPGVSWGDWQHFEAETAELVPWSVLVPYAAVAATIAELVLGSLLVLGWKWRWTGKLTAGLFVVYAMAMVPGMGAGSVLEFGLPVLVGGALVTSARGSRPTQTGQRVSTPARAVAT
ncbi:MAG: hypothetical protein ABIO16_06000 [Nocardioides sp.]